jgi:hypothetical protein
MMRTFARPVGLVVAASLLGMLLRVVTVAVAGVDVSADYDWLGVLWVPLAVAWGLVLRRRREPSDQR